MTDLNVNETLESYRGWLTGLAGAMAIDQELRQDLAQEGWIAMWKAIHTYDPDKGKLDWWLKFKAKGRMLQYFNYKYLRETAVDGGQDVEDEGSSFWDRKMIPVMEEFEMAYHEGQIRDAIESLTEGQQRIVRLKFWQNLDWKQLTEVYGYEPTGIWRGARKNLRAKLSHLEGVV